MDLDLDLNLPAADAEAATAASRRAPAPTQPTVPNTKVRRLCDMPVVRAALDLLPAFAVYAAVRVAGLVALSLLGGSQGIDPWPRLTSYDGMWLLWVAGDGYDPLIPGADSSHPGLSNIAFFPLYPLLVAGLSHVAGTTLATTALTITALSGLAAAAALDQLGRRVAGSRTAGLVLVVLWAA